MKAIVCEKCSSNDLVFQDGFFVCQNCGTKYNPEDTARLLVELSGTVDISGSNIKIDKSDVFDNYLILARRAAEEGDHEEAAYYYEILSVNRPNSWEACFYSIYFRAVDCSIGEISDAACKVAKRIPSTIRLIKSYVPEEEQQEAYTKVAESVSELRELFYDQAENEFIEHTVAQGALSLFENRCYHIFRMEIELSSSIWNAFHDHDLAIEHLKICDTEEANIDRESLYQLMEQIDPEIAKEAKEKYAQNVKAKAKHKKTFCIFAAILGIVILGAGFLVVPPISYILYLIGGICTAFGLFGLIRTVK